MRPLPALIVGTLLALAAVACGSAGKDAGSGTHGSSATGAIAGASASTPASGSTSLEGDEDDDDSSSNYLDSTKYDNDADFDDDRGRQLGYRDSDDDAVLAYGRAASAAEKRALTAIVKRYYSAAVAANGATGCSLFTPALRNAVPEDYGQAPGPVYMRGKTCPAVITLFFKHEHQQLASAMIEVTDVRVKGNEALAVVGSRAQPASEIALERHPGGPWRLADLIAVRLP
jgi:hypothetical protein